MRMESACAGMGPGMAHMHILDDFLINASTVYGAGISAYTQC